MNLKSVFFSIFLIATIVSCKDNAASKINNQNLETAKERDTHLTTGLAQIKFNKTEHDFGIINEGDIVETTFEIENTGTGDLVISDAFATCGCTVPQWPKEPIKPKEKGILKVAFDSNGRQNKQQKTITLVTNTENGKESLTITTFVTPKSK